MIVPDFNNLWLAAGTGFFMGLRHAADADHVIAVSTIVCRGRKLSSAWLIGAAWGLGHTATLLAAGVAVLALQSAMPDGLADGLERVVGAMLVVLGALAFSGRNGNVREHTHPHSHGEGHGHHLGERAEHAHAHMHVPEIDALARGERPRLGRSFLVGTVHGLAGSSALSLALLAAMPSLAAGAAYILVFGLGTLAGMAALSTVFSLSIARLSSVHAIDRWLRPSIGAFSVAFGLLLALGMAP
ncbi:MAG: hypothetical protein HY925_11290 [Elusimicrobia bacterium]|nr:hypothetical protein [Elusimicrobiota bacterium]